VQVWVAISAEAKFLTVSIATFRDKQALCGIFQCVLTTFISQQNSITTTIQARLLWTLETAKEAKVDTLIFTAHAHCFTVTEGFSFLCYCFTKIKAQFSPS